MIKMVPSNGHGEVPVYQERRLFRQDRAQMSGQLGVSVVSLAGDLPAEG